MKKKTKDHDSSADVISTWMKSAGEFWDGMFQAWSDMAPFGKPQNSTSQVDPGSRTQASMNSILKNFQVFSKAILEPEIMSSLMKGTGAIPDILLKLEQSSYSSLLQLQQKWIERVGRLGKSSEAFKFEDLDENAFRAWSDIYEKEIQQFLNIPQLGLARFHQERMNRAIDKYTIFQSTLGEFLRLLYLPVTHSLAAMQEKVGEMVESEALPEDAKAYYQMWIKLLEGHYMTLFQSPEYIQMLGKILQSMSEFSMAKNAVFEDLLSAFPIPKQTDMDDLYQELYVLKKRIKLLEKKETKFK